MSPLVAAWVSGFLAGAGVATVLLSEWTRRRRPPRPPTPLTRRDLYVKDRAA